MAMQRIYATIPQTILQAGHQGENLARCVCFDLSGLIEQYGSGTWAVVFKRPFEAAPYLVANYDTVGDYAVWGLDNTDTAIAGEGRVEMRYYVDEVLCKTDVYAVLILPSLGAAGPTPSPYEDLIDTVKEYAETAEGAASAAVAAKEIVVEDKAIVVSSTATAVYSAQVAQAAAEQAVEHGYAVSISGHKLVFTAPTPLT